MARGRKHERGTGARSSWTVAATIIALALTLTTASLTLLGYGHDFAFLEVAAGMHPEDLHRTPLDFLLLGWRPVLHALEGLNRFLSWDVQLRIAAGLWQRAGSFLLLVASLWTITAMLLAFFDRPRRRVLAAAFLRPKTPRAAWRKVRRWARYAGACMQGAVTWLWSVRSVFVGWLAIPGFFALMFLLLWGLWFITALAAILIAGVPIVGASSGTARAHAEVTGDVLCRWPPDGNYRGARCVSIMQSQLEVARGRVVGEVDKRALLYDPCSRSTSWIPTEGRTVTTLRRLAPARQSASCR